MLARLMRFGGDVAERGFTLFTKTTVNATKIVAREVGIAEGMSVGGKRVGEALESIVSSEATEKVATLGARTAGELFHAIKGTERVALATAAGEARTTMSFVDRIVAVEKENVLLRQQIMALGHTPLSHVSPVLTMASQSVSGQLAKEAAETAATNGGKLATIRHGVSGVLKFASNIVKP